MNFVHPLFLVGLAAAMVPVLIHLLTRDRVRKVAFSTLRFFGQNSQRVLRRKRWQEMVLLAMRMLICALLAVAFARPFFGKKVDLNAGMTARRARVIVADVSGSMGRSGGAEKLKAACKAAIGELTEGNDAVGLVTFADTANVEAEVSTKFDKAGERIAALVTGQGGTDIPGALAIADDLLKNVKATTKEVVLISDLQRTGWSGAGGQAKGSRETKKLAADVKLVVKSLAPAGGVLPHGDLLIVDRYCPESVVMDGTPQGIAVKLANLSTQPMNDVPVKLTIGGKDAGSQKVNLKPESTLLVQFSHVFDVAGDTPIVVHAGADAALIPETTAFFNARVMGKIPVVIVNGAPSSNRAADGAFFLSLALSPKGSPPFDVRVVDITQAKAEDFKDAAVVVLADVDKLKIGVNQALYELLQRGGGVMFMPGEHVSASVFNAQFAGTDQYNDLAPCKLKGVLTTAPVPGEVGGISLSKIDFQHVIFREFSQPHHGDFSGVRFFRWWEVRDYQGAVKAGEKEVSEAERPRVVARFDDGRPAILDRQVGRGISLLVASSTDLRWTNFAEKAAVFQPFVHLAAKYLSIRTEAKTAYTVGDLLGIPSGCEVKDPTGTKHDDKETAGQKNGMLAKAAGLYTLSDKAGKQAFVYAVNVDPAEMDTATVSADEIASAVEQPKDEVVGGGAIVKDAAKDQDTGRLWWYLAAAVGAMFAMELLVANRTMRH